MFGCWVGALIRLLCSFMMLCEGEVFSGLVLLVFMAGLLCIRCPYVYSISWLVYFVMVLVFPLFTSVVSMRSMRSFFLSLVPCGVPLWVAPLVCVAETVSYIVRPFVLLLRPMVNMGFGAVMGALLGTACCTVSGSLLYFYILLLVALFLYEVFVVCIHWFIVREVLIFSLIC